MHKHKRYSFKTLIEILIVSTRLGVTSFGGPIAHLGYFYEEYIRKRKWLDEKAMLIWLRCASSCLGRRAVKLELGLELCVAGYLAVSFHFSALHCPLYWHLSYLHLC